MLKIILRRIGITPLYYYILNNCTNIVINLYSILTSKTRIKSYINSNKTCKLHIGCGTNLIDGWLNTDLYPRNTKAVRLNAFKMDAIPDKSFDYVYSEHMIEHLTYTQAEIMIKECSRILKPGGKIRIATPDMQFLLDLMNPEKTQVQKDYINYITEKDIKSNIYSDCFVINNFFYNYTHRFIFSKEILQKLLSDNGFNTFEFQKPGISNDPNLTNIEHHGFVIGDAFNELESMVVEANHV